MPSIIGPYDGRKARRKRCDACVNRKIKCHGGIPCNNCKRTNRPCAITINPTNASLVFVGQTPNKGDLLAMAKSSPVLKDAIDAVAALHSKRRDQLAYVGHNDDKGNIDALQAYTRSVRRVQEKIAANTFMKDESALWTTFFLGLFELMRDSTGTNWLSHFLHGTSTMLRLQNPETLADLSPQNAQRRSFFLATRIFEISRSFIFSSPTFLSRPEWSAAMARLWDGEGAMLWHPKEALFDMLPLFSELSIRTLGFCEEALQFAPCAQHDLVKSLGNEGMVLQASLQQWFLDATTWSIAFPPFNQSKPDTESLTGFFYYHATSIYLSGTYDYHPHWTSIDAPILPRKTIDWHVAEILRISHELLAQGVAGVLLLFPLRVAGSRAIDGQSRDAILGLLQTTARRGFVVAEAFTVELADLWAREGGDLLEVVLD